jgi:UDP-glucose 6-dehydrogenase
MKFAIDRIEKNIVICQNLKTEEMYEFKLESMPKEIEEGSIIKYSNNKFLMDKKSFKNRKKEIEEKMKKLRNDEE